MATLIFGGVLDRHPDLDIWISHGGGGLPMLAGRLAQAARKRPWASEDIRKDGAFEEAVTRLWYDAHVTDPSALGPAPAMGRQRPHRLRHEFRRLGPAGGGRARRDRPGLGRQCAAAAAAGLGQTGRQPQNSRTPPNWAQVDATSQPASTTMFCPVIADERSEARNSTASATSFGSTIRPSAVNAPGCAA